MTEYEKEISARDYAIQELVRTILVQRKHVADLTAVVRELINSRIRETI